MKTNKKANPIFRYLNLSIIPANKKNIERSPKMAKILEKNTMYGSLVTEKIAGMESTAKIRSVNSIIIKTRNSGVIFLTPSIVAKNLLPTNWL